MASLDSLLRQSSPKPSPLVSLRYSRQFWQKLHRRQPSPIRNYKLLATSVLTRGLKVFFFYCLRTSCANSSSYSKRFSWRMSTLLWGRVTSGSSWMTGNSTWKKSSSSFLLSSLTMSCALVTTLVERVVLIFLLISSLTMVRVSMMICRFSVVRRWLMMIFLGSCLQQSYDQSISTMSSRGQMQQYLARELEQVVRMSHLGDYRARWISEESHYWKFLLRQSLVQILIACYFSLLCMLLSSILSILCMYFFSCCCNTLQQGARPRQSSIMSYSCTRVKL